MRWRMTINHSIQSPDKKEPPLTQSRQRGVDQLAAWDGSHDPVPLGFDSTECVQVDLSII